MRAPSPPRDPVLAVIGDVHAELGRLARVLDRINEVDADATLLVGDLACAGHDRTRDAAKLARYRAQVAAVLAAVQARGRPWAFVPGNHDLPGLQHPANIDGRVVELAGLRVGGIGGAGPDLFGFAYEWPEDHVRRRPLPAVDLLLCHAPPRDTPLDRSRRGDAHVGSQALRERALAMRGVLVCGHIHECAGAVQLGDCLCFNVGALGAPYGQVQVGFVHGLDRVVHEDLDSGASREWRRQPAGSPP